MSRTTAAASILDRLRFLAPRRWSGLVTFNYHRIGDPGGSPFDHQLWSATTEELDRQLSFLRRDCDIVHPRDVPELQRRRRGRHVLVTFDDGYRDTYEHALPVLRRHGVPALVFITTGFLDERGVAWWDEIAWMVRRSARPAVPASPWMEGSVELVGDREPAVQRLLKVYKELPVTRTGEYLGWLAEVTGSGRFPAEAASQVWMTWSMVRELRDAGMVIGGHTVSHPVLSRMDRAAQAAEIAGCERRLREELGEPLRWFAYPVGGSRSFDEDTRAVLAEAGVELAFSDYGGYRRYDDWDPLDVRRIAVETYVTGDYFRSLARWPSLMAPRRGQGLAARVGDALRGWIGI